jgi:hypothetical protein
MSANRPNSDPNIPDPDTEKPETKKKPDIVTFRTNRDAKKTPSSSFDAFMDYIRDNTKDSIAYVAMVVGILLMLFDAYSPYGGLIVGIVFSLYFSKELIFFINNIKDFIEEYGVVKSLMLAGALLALFIKVPFFFIGMAAVLAIQLFVWPGEKKP